MLAAKAFCCAFAIIAASGNAVVPVTVETGRGVTRVLAPVYTKGYKRPAITGFRTGPSIRGANTA